MISVLESIKSVYTRLQAPYTTKLQESGLQDIECNPDDDRTGRHLDHLAAWKYIGYPGFSKWLSVHGRFAIRRFSALNTRVLLDNQNEIVKLERELKAMDDFAQAAPMDQGGCGSLRTDAMTPRGRLVKKISRMLREYNKNVSAFLHLQERPSATPGHVNSLRHWLANRPNVIERPEQDFVLEHADDLVVVGDSEPCQFGSWLQRIGHADDADCLPMSKASRQRSKSLRRHLELLKSLVISLFMLLGPTWGLTLTLDTEERLTVVSLFTVLFSLAVGFGTPLRTMHRYLAIAGYFAILMLILRLVPISRPEAGELGNYQ